MSANNDKASSPVSTSHSATHRIYPAYTFPAAPTFNKWVHLAVADVHALRQEPSFQGQNIYFHLNHPIEYVYITGAVVAVDHIITQYSTRFTVLEIDDGSGATIEVKISYQTPKIEDSEQQPDESANAAEDVKSHPLLKTRVFQTTVDNLTVIAGPRGTDLFIDDPKFTGAAPARIDVGTVLKAKGTLQRWRDTYQLALRRVFLVTSLDEEAQAWIEYSEFASSVLSKPWVLSDQQIRHLERKHVQQAEEQRRRQAHRHERQQHKERKREAREKTRARLEQRVERRLALEAVADDLDGNPLDRPGWKPAPAVEAVEPLQHSPTRVSTAPHHKDVMWHHEFKEDASLADFIHKPTDSAIASTHRKRRLARAGPTAAPHHSTLPWHHEIQDDRQLGHVNKGPPFSALTTDGSIRDSRAPLSAAPRPESIPWNHELQYTRGNGGPGHREAV